MPTDGDDDFPELDEPFLKLAVAPDRGRIVIVNFDMGGGAIGQEMRKPGRPCVVVQNNKLRRGRLVTVVPLSGQAPETVMPYHHRMDHRSFRLLPLEYGGQGKERWAKCDYITTVSLDRCCNPYSRPPYQPRKYVNVSVIRADLEAVERCVAWALGIRLPAP
jgi:uncharacterized protein YifN (PemK superfamily)